MVKVVTKVNVAKVEVNVISNVNVNVDVGTHTYSGGKPYIGEYEFTPTQSTQIIPIADQTAAQDITINPIPNNYGLITRIGSRIKVS